MTILLIKDPYEPAGSAVLLYDRCLVKNHLHRTSAVEVIISETGAVCQTAPVWEVRKSYYNKDCHHFEKQLIYQTLEIFIHTTSVMKQQPFASAEPKQRLQNQSGTSADSSEATAGWFSPDSMIRQMSQEALGLLGGGRAILLQLAHPLIAAGVDDYSGFQADPLARLLHTIELMHTLVFGSRSQAEKALKRFHVVHERIKGRLPDAAGGFMAGTTYSGSDPHLKLWVAATLVDTNLIAYKLFVRELTGDQQQDYYADTLVLARLMGIPEEILPSNLEAFRRYMKNMLAGDTLVVTDTARRLAWDVLQPEGVGIISAACARLLRFTTAGLLPPRFRKAYQLTWDRRQQRLLEMFSRTTQRLRPRVPKWVWQSPLLDGRLARFLLWGMTTPMSGKVNY